MLKRLPFLTLLYALLAGPAAAAAALSPRPAVPIRAAQPAPVPRPWLGWLAAGAGAVLAIRMKDTAALAQKFVQRAAAAQGDYVSGVQAAGSDWETNAKAGESNYEAGVQEAIGKKRYGRGISSAGQAKYVGNAVKLGSQRYVPGVQNAQDAWARGFGPVADKIKSLQLPPPGPRRSPQNQQRANMVALELGKLKDGQ